MQAPDAQAAVQGQKLNLLVSPQSARDKRASDHGSKAFHGKHSIYRQARIRGQIPWRHCSCGTRKLIFQFSQSRAGSSAHDDDRYTLQKRAMDELFDLQLHQPNHVWFSQVCLGYYDDSALNSQQSADIEVFAGLRLDAFVGGYY